jgi:polyisoprenoid-binding protein YceI
MLIAGSCLVLSSAGIAAAGAWHTSQGDVRVMCPMTIGGSFDAKSSSLSGSLTASGTHIDGTLAVDLKTLDTGISLRNEHMRDNYLEVGKGAGYDSATLTAIELKGLNGDAPEGKGSFAGMLTLHGVTRSIGGPVEVRKAGSGLRIKASFPVNLPDYNIPEPRYLGVGVKNTVQADVTFTITQ